MPKSGKRKRVGGEASHLHIFVSSLNYRICCFFYLELGWSYNPIIIICSLQKPRIAFQHL